MIAVVAAALDLLVLDCGPRPGGGRSDIGGHSSGALRARAPAHWPVHRSRRGATVDPAGDDAKAAAAPFAEALDAEITELLRLEALIVPPTNLQSCHRDVWADNILPTPTGGVCVIDCENCGLADPAQELPMAMIDFAFGDQRRIAELYLSYLETGRPARVSGYSSFTMVIARSATSGS
jgi:aminoglycoside phosphotransferase (APT) family kinase protein